MLKHKKEVIKSSAVINMSSTEMSLIQRQAFNYLLAYAYDNLLKKDVFILPFRELAEAMGFNSKNSKYLKEAIKGIKKCEIEVNIFDKVNKLKIEGGSVLLSSAYFAEQEGDTTGKSYLFYAFDPILKSQLAKPEMYAKINLLLQSSFNSLHSLSLYENAIDYLDLARGKGTIPLMSIEKCKGLLGVSLEEYQEFKEFNKFVIKKSIKEIKAKTGLEVEAETKRTGRKITDIRFHIKATRNLLSPQDEKNIIEAQVSELSDDELLLDLLSNELKVNQVIAKSFINECDPNEITKLLEDTKRNFKSSQTINISFGGYLTGAIKNYMQDRKVLFEKKRKKEELLKDKAQREQEEEARAEEESQKRAKKMRESKSRRDETFAYVFNSLSESDRESIFEKYSLNLKTKITKYNLEKKQHLANSCQAILKSFEEKKLFADKVRDDFYTFLLINKIFEYSADENKVKVNL